MADTDRIPAYALIARVAQEPHRFGFFEILRRMECLHPEKPRIGTSKRLADDPVRLGQEPHLDFAPATLAAYQAGHDGADRLRVYFFGLFGPNGPLPLHLTEYARERLRHHHDPTFARFGDIFHHRLLSLFYRAWAEVQPTVSLDRPADDRFGFYLGSLCGYGFESLRERDAMPDAAKLGFSGTLGCEARHPDGLRALLSDLLRVPVAIREFVGEWMRIPNEDRSRLGASPLLSSLASSLVLGERVFACQHKFRIALGPLRLPDYRNLLPGGLALRRLVAIVRNYLGDELVWDVNLMLKAAEVPALALDGSPMLGWTTWLGQRPSQLDADDLTLDPLYGAG